MTCFRVIVTGSRRWTDRETIATRLAVLASEHGDLIVVHGACPTGADYIAAEWCDASRTVGLKWAAGGAVAIDEPHPADWDHCAPECKPGHRKTRRDGRTYCPTAGFRRNQAMADAGANLCLAFSLNNSPGTADMVKRAEAAGIPVELVER